MAPSSTRSDARTVVAEHAFRVTPDLLGQPLAGPWRRGIAMTVDGFALAVLVNAPSVVFGIAAALVLLRASAKPVTGGVIWRSVRRATRLTAGAILFAISASLWGAVADYRGRGSQTDVAAVAEGVEISALSGVVAGVDLLGFVRAEDEVEALRRANGVLSQFEADAAGRQEIASALREIAESEPASPWLAAAVDSMVGLDRGDVAPDDGAADDLESTRVMVDSYAAALASDDTAGAGLLRRDLATTLAADTLVALERVAQRERDRVAALGTEVERLRQRSRFRAALREVREDLGLGLGWTGLYFTAFFALWRGQTPGKRLLRIRVVRLDGLPLGWWGSFERFGGYAAGFATGLLGFLQIFWDRNRQAIQDKICATIVIREPRR